MTGGIISVMGRLERWCRQSGEAMEEWWCRKSGETMEEWWCKWNGRVNRMIEESIEWCLSSDMSIASVHRNTCYVVSHSVRRIHRLMASILRATWKNIGVKWQISWQLIVVNLWSHCWHHDPMALVWSVGMESRSVWEWSSMWSATKSNLSRGCRHRRW